MRSLVVITLCFLICTCFSQDAPETNNDLAELKSLGDKALADNKLDDAIKYYTSAIKLDPEDVTFNYKRAAAYLLKGKNFNALEDLNIVLQNKPSFHQVTVRT
jgi:tetratricopeptide (TPR) repeat protein